MIKYESEEKWCQAALMKPSKHFEVYEIVSVRPKTIRIKYENSNQISFLDLNQKSHFRHLSKKKIHALWIDTAAMNEGDKITVENEDFLVEDTEFIRTLIGPRNSFKLTRTSYYPRLERTVLWYDRQTGILLKEAYERTFQRQPRRGLGRLLAINTNIKDINIPELLNRTLKCSFCGNLLGWAHRNAKYCPFCGQRIAAQNGTRIYGILNVCTSCGAINSPQANFCNQCGTKLTNL